MERREEVDVGQNVYTIGRKFDSAEECNFVRTDGHNGN